MNPKVKEVKPLEDYKLFLIFTNKDYSLNMESDENFCFIVGYTSNGVPYGITWDDVDILNYEFEQN